MTKNTETIARKIILNTLLYLENKNSVMKHNILVDLKELAEIFHISVSFKKNPKNKVNIKPALYQFINPNIGYSESISKLFYALN